MRSTQKKIVIIIPYFGKLPWYFQYFIHCCKKNRSIDFFIVTDDISYNKKVPKNIRILNKSFAELKKLIKQKLQLNVQIPDAYKLCDFKPAYGIIFEEYIREYDFWGMGDIDVIYGNIRHFMTNDVLDNYDVISVRHDFLVGYFTLFRNSKKINNLFKESKDYKKVFTTEEHFCFDECNFAFWMMDHDISFEDVASLCKIDSMTHVVKRLQSQKKLNAYFDTHAIEGIAGQLTWNNGKLVFKRHFEIMLYHMIILKKIYSRPAPKFIPGKFSISPTRIYHH